MPNQVLTSHFYDLVDQPAQTILQPLATGTPWAEFDGFDLAGNQNSYQDFANQTRTYTPDGLNRLTNELDASAAGLPITVSSQYDPNGNLITQQRVEVLSSATPTPTATYVASAGYNAADWRTTSNDNGLVTQYDPSLKRFLQPDPSEQEGTRSYVYAGDDPLDMADPSGLAGIPEGMLGHVPAGRVGIVTVVESAKHPYRGAIRIAPSRRITSPLSI